MAKDRSRIEAPRAWQCLHVSSGHLRATNLEHPSSVLKHLVQLMKAMGTHTGGFTFPEPVCYGQLPVATHSRFPDSVCG